MVTSIYPDLVGSIIPNVGAGGYELGLRFTSNRDAWLLGARVYRHNPANAGPFRARLWSQDGNFLAYTPLETPTELGWTSLYFTLPQRLRAGSEYIVSYNSPGFFAVQGEGNPAPAQAGPLIALGGRYNTVPGAFPVTPHVTNTYLVDPLVSFDPPKIPFGMGVAGAPPVGDPNEAVPATAALLIGDRIDYAALPWDGFAGWDFLLTDMHFVTKILGAFTFPGEDPNSITPASVTTWRNSYFHFIWAGGMISVTSEDGQMHQVTPIVVRGGAAHIQFDFQNSAPEVQNMEGGVQGWLVPAGSWRQAP